MLLRIVVFNLGASALALLTACSQAKLETSRTCVVYAMRHGESESNIRGVISRSLLTSYRFPLTELGRSQARAAVSQARKHALLNSETIILSSPFRRAKDTAAIAAEVLGSGEPTDRLELGERFFGDFEGLTNSHYEIVWQEDALDAERNSNHVEPVNSVAERMLRAYESARQRCDAVPDGRATSVLLVSHGDPLQILETALRGRDLREHGRIPMIKTSEIRELP